MEPNNAKEAVKRQRSAQEIQQLIEEYERSEGISVKEYCDMIGISDATFYNWQKKYGKGKAEDQMDAEFIPVEITGLSGGSGGVQMEVRVIRFYGAISCEQIKVVLS